MTQRPLKRFPITTTADPRSLRNAVGTLTGYEHSVRGSVRESMRQQGVVNGLNLGELTLFFVAYANQVDVLAPPTGSQVLVVLPLGPMGVAVNNQSWTMGTPFTLSASHRTHMFPHPHAGALVGAIPVMNLQSRLRDIFHSTREFGFHLEQARPITMHAGSSLHRLWIQAASQQSLPDQSDFLDSITVGLAPYLKHDDAGLTTPHPPPYLLAALQYMNRHYAEQISLADLSNAVGISPRQLQLSFRAHLSTTAQEYLRNLRLDHAHQMIRNTSRANITITEVATQVGIPHLSRFARYFAERFGQLPSTVQN